MKFPCLKKSTLCGDVKSILSPQSKAGYTKAFYASNGETPTATTATPINTGISVGGFGAPYTATPAFTTPVISWNGGAYVTAAPNDVCRLQNYYFSEKKIDKSKKLSVLEINYFNMINKHQCLKNNAGVSWFNGDEDIKTANSLLEEMLNCSTLYNDNKNGLIKNLEYKLSDKTKSLIKNKENFIDLNYHLLCDIYSEIISISPQYIKSLTGNIEESEIGGVETYPCEHMYYRGLFPVSELNYNSNKHITKITRCQYSPIIYKNFEFSSLPVTCTNFDFENDSNDTVEITLLLTQENMSGFNFNKANPGGQDAHFYIQKTAKNMINKPFNIKIGENQKIKGVQLTQSSNDENKYKSDFDGDIAIGVLYDKNDKNIHISSASQYFSNQEDYTVQEALHTGRLIEKDIFAQHYTGRENISAGLCINIEIEPGKSKNITFIQVIDFSDISIKNYNAQKKYTEFFPRKIDRVIEISKFVGENLYEIEKAIRKDFEKIYNEMNSYISFKDNDEIRKNRFITMLINQLSYFPSATVWSKNDDVFIKECAEYPFFNPLDVYFYGSFALFYLMPQFDKIILRKFSDAILLNDSEVRNYHIYRFFPNSNNVSKSNRGERLVAGAVIHDLGCVYDMKPNAYYWRNVKCWRDLGPKFILLAYRNFVFTKEKETLEYLWPAIKETMNYLTQNLDNGINIPLVKDGHGDTFDNISSFGITVYNASLWLAAIKVYIKILEHFSDNNEMVKFENLLKKATTEFNEHLWDDENEYYHFYTSPITLSCLNDVSEDDLKLLRSMFNIRENSKKINLCNLINKINSFIRFNGNEIVQEIDFNLINNFIKKKFNNISYFTKDEKFSKARLRTLKKLYLFCNFKSLQNDEFEYAIKRDSDDIFVNQLLADTYLTLLDLKPITNISRQEKILNKIYLKSNEFNSGISNILPCNKYQNNDEQGNEKWVGVQYSNAGSLINVKKFKKSFKLCDEVYNKLYNELKIPLAAPEAFISNGFISIEDINIILNADREKAENVLRYCKSESVKWINDNGRVSSKIPEEYGVFKKIILLNNECKLKDDEVEDLYKYFKSLRVNYTVGNYFRPGMIFIIPMLLKKANNA